MCFEREYFIVSKQIVYFGRVNLTRICLHCSNTKNVTVRHVTRYIFISLSLFFGVILLFFITRRTRIVYMFTYISRGVR